jgi:hypothetical protein
MEETLATHSIVTREQFEINNAGITHRPTDYSFKPYPGTPFDGTVNRGQLGNKLPSGEDYRPQEVEEMARRLWAEHVGQKNI